MIQKYIFLFILGCTFFCMQSNAQEVILNKRNLSPEAVTNALDKADKIVEKLSLTEPTIKENITNVIANRYMELREIHIAYEKRNASIESLELNKQEKDSLLERSYYHYNNDLYRSRFGYITWLSFYLDEGQIEKVRNEMTSNMFFKYYKLFEGQVPQMTDNQKHRVRAWLKEAREFAMDFETERKMRQMFIKYRGRINNYLSKCGYDLSKSSK